MAEEYAPESHTHAPRTRLIVIVGAMLVALPFVGLGVLKWVQWRRQSAEEAFRRPVRTLRCEGESVNAVAFTPDGRGCLAGGTGAALHRWRLTGEALPPLGGETGGATGEAGAAAELCALAVSADGRWAATGDRRGALVVWDLERERERRRPAPFTGAVHRLAFSGDGALLAAADGQGRVRVERLAGPAAAGDSRPAFTEREILALVFPPEAGRLLALKADGVLFARETAARPNDQILRQYNRHLSAAVFLPGARRVLFADAAGSLVLAGVEESGGSEIELGRPSGQTTALSVSPDGRWAVSGGRGGSRGARRMTLQLWDLAAGRPYRSFEPPREPEERDSQVLALAFAADNRHFLAGGWWEDQQGQYHARLALWRLPDEFGFRLIGGRSD